MDTDKTLDKYGLALQYTVAKDHFEIIFDVFLTLF